MTILRNLLAPAEHQQALPEDEVPSTYHHLRRQVFLGIFIGYTGYYLVRNNFSLAIPDLIDMGYTKAELGIALSGVSVAYGLSKFFMGNLSDRSNARLFITTGLVLSALTMMTMGLLPFATGSVFTMFSARDIFFQYVLNNRLLWIIALANGFVYLVRYGAMALT